MTARLLSIQADAAAATHPDWRTVLRACGADESFLRTHGGDGASRSGSPSSCCWTGCSRARRCTR